jgi:hypothetical protein
MPVRVDSDGRVTVANAPETRGLAGRVFRRRDPQADAADVVICLGAMDVGGYGSPAAELCVASATFGAVPPDWDSATVTYDLAAFAEDYTEVTDAERGILAAEQAVEAKAASERAETRESPWRRS